MKKKILLLATTLITCFFSIGTSEAVYFQPANNTPRSLVFNLNKGQEQSFFEELTNNEGSDAIVEIGIVDGFQNKNGDISHRLATETQFMLGTWTTPQLQQVSLKKDEKKILEFKIKVPEDALPGTYSGGLTTIVLKTQENEQNEMVGGKVTVRNLIPFYINIEGEVINDFKIINTTLVTTPKTHTASIKVKNAGNTIVKSNLSITVKNSLLKTEKTYSKENILSLPNTESTIDFPMDKELIGNYEAQITLENKSFNPTGNNYLPLNKQVFLLRFKYIPWNLIIAILLGFIFLLLTFGVYIILKIIFHFRCQHYTVKKNETIESIAKKFNIKWIRIAKLNHLKAPYSLNNDQKILLPPYKK